MYSKQLTKFNRISDYKEMSHLNVNDRIINVAKSRIKRNMFAYNVMFLSR